jgi:hypothetical protein
MVCIVLRRIKGAREDAGSLIAAPRDSRVLLDFIIAQDGGHYTSYKLNIWKLNHSSCALEICKLFLSFERCTFQNLFEEKLF